MIGLAILLLTGFAVLWLSGVALAVWMLMHPPRRTYGSAVARGRPGDPMEMQDSPRPFEKWVFKSRGLHLPVWDIRGDAADGPVVIMTHGWADSRIGSLVRLSAFLPVASRIVIWDLPGHGEARGVCRLGTAEIEDLVALVEHVSPQKLLLVGWSLGAGVSIAAAIRLAPGKCLGIIAESPYRVPATPATNVLRARGLPASIIVGPALLLLRMVFGGGLGPSRFDRARHAASADIPIMVLHGSDDAVCPVQDGRDIAAAATGAGGRLVEIPGGGHNDLWTEPRFAELCEREVQEFVRRIGRTA